MSVIWTNGCFDVLHRGHIELFEFAKSIGTWLTVGLDTDERVKRSKGEQRPFNNLGDRIKMLEAIRFIDEIKIFNSDIQLKKQIVSCNAETIVIGSDYKEKKVIGSNLVKKVIFFDRIKNYSTSKILNDIRI
tara:strand:+ start:2414 stop:2809 length:396 start_codon:yes stop_codon:yes gene_type:complete